MKSGNAGYRWFYVIVSALCLAGCGDDGDLDTSLRQTMDAAGIHGIDPGPWHEDAKVELGRSLFFDKELSGNRDIACATCHHPKLATGDGLSLSIGTGGHGLGNERVMGKGRRFVPRNATEIFNRGASAWTTMFWDMRVSGDPEHGFSTPAGKNLPGGLDSVLAAQAMFPVTSRDEMRGASGDLDVFGAPNEIALHGDKDFNAMWSDLMKRLLAIPEYVDLFARAYPDTPISALGFEHAANAIAAFEARAFTFSKSPWDRYVTGEDVAMSADQKQGALLFFGKARCATCHAGDLFTDQKAHSLAVPQLGPGKGEESPFDYGRGRESHDPRERYSFRTPPLRNVALSGPWMHDGACVRLDDVVRHHLNPAAGLRHYDIAQLTVELRGTVQEEQSLTQTMLAQLDPRVLPPVELTDEEFRELMSFLDALTDPEAQRLDALLPARVPSGLPVED